MKWAKTGLAALAVIHAGAAHAEPQNSDLWIGFPDSENGFLLDEATGNVWMTGPCLKTLETAVNTGALWVSHTIELVSIGRSMVTLDQRFELDTNPIAPQITVISNGRGGAQNFSVIVDRNCTTGGRCHDLILSQQACQG